MWKAIQDGRLYSHWADYYIYLFIWRTSSFTFWSDFRMKNYYLLRKRERERVQRVPFHVKEDGRSPSPGFWRQLNMEKRKSMFVFLSTLISFPFFFFFMNARRNDTISVVGAAMWIHSKILFLDIGYTILHSGLTHYQNLNDQQPRRTNNKKMIF